MFTTTYHKHIGQCMHTCYTIMHSYEGLFLWATFLQRFFPLLNKMCAPISLLLRPYRCKSSFSFIQSRQLKCSEREALMLRTKTSLIHPSNSCWTGFHVGASRSFMISYRKRGGMGKQPSEFRRHSLSRFCRHTSLANILHLIIIKIVVVLIKWKIYVVPHPLSLEAAFRSKATWLL